jgi:hypothetical protein
MKMMNHLYLESRADAKRHMDETIRLSNEGSRLQNNKEVVSDSEMPPYVRYGTRECHGQDHKHQNPSHRKSYVPGMPLRKHRISNPIQTEESESRPQHPLQNRRSKTNPNES